MDYEFVHSGDFLVIKLSGAAGINERLWVKESLTPHLRQSCRKVIVDLGGLDEAEGVYILGVLNTIKKEFQLMGCEVKLCSPKTKLHRYFKENRLDQIFDIKRSLGQAKRSFGKKGNEV